VAELIDLRKEKDFSSIKPVMAANPYSKDSQAVKYETFAAQSLQDYKSNNSAYKERLKDYETNKQRLCGEVLSYCEQELVNKLKKT
jgi:hypothetical protein